MGNWTVKGSRHFEECR